MIEFSTRTSEDDIGKYPIMLLMKITTFITKRTFFLQVFLYVIYLLNFFKQLILLHKRWRDQYQALF